MNGLWCSVWPIFLTVLWPSIRLVDWPLVHLIARLVVGLVALLVDHLIDWIIDWHGLVDRLMDSIVDRLKIRLASIPNTTRREGIWPSRAHTAHQYSQIDMTQKGTTAFQPRPAQPHQYLPLTTQHRRGKQPVSTIPHRVPIPDTTWKGMMSLSWRVQGHLP